MDLVNWKDEYHRQYGGHAEDQKNSDADIVPSQHGELPLPRSRGSRKRCL
jgi:hypothetical protein